MRLGVEQTGYGRGIVIRVTCVVCALLLMLTLGCGTLESTLARGVWLPYGGVRVDAELATGEDVFIPFSLLDLPLSAVLDTLLLPVTIPVYLRK